MSSSPIGSCPTFPELIFLARTLAVVLAYPLVWLQQKSLLSSKAIRLSRNTPIGRIKLLLSDMGKGFDFWSFHLSSIWVHFYTLFLGFRRNFFDFLFCGFDRFGNLLLCNSLNLSNFALCLAVNVVHPKPAELCLCQLVLEPDNHI